ncbi:MAG: hypothetical protein KAF40_08955, partial [Flavihumibacter sp.]|nr:hypothetical protein [Flavihumibacter sp.]
QVELVEAPVNRQVVFSIYAAGDYSAPSFRQVETAVTLTAGVINIETGVFTKTWDTVISRPILDFPVEEQAVTIEKSIPLRLNKERLQVAHSIRYNNNGQLSQTANFETVPSDQVRHLKIIGL